jgi:hypothetical protein
VSSLRLLGPAPIAWRLGLAGSTVYRAEALVKIVQNGWAYRRAYDSTSGIAALPGFPAYSGYRPHGAWLDTDGAARGRQQGLVQISGLVEGWRRDHTPSRPMPFPHRHPSLRVDSPGATCTCT